MDKENVKRVIFNFTINNNNSKIKNKRHNSNFNTKHYKNGTPNNIDGEIWKPIKGFDDIYYVSNKGRIKNIISNKLMSTFIVGNYYKVSLKAIPYFVHKLVAIAFIPNPDNKQCVDHIDTNTFNNNIENLKWATIKENNNNPITVSKQVNRLRSYNVDRKIKVIKFKYKDYNNTEIFDSVLNAAKSINDSSTNISRVCKANSKVSVPRYRCKGYCFMYEDNFNSLVKHCNEIKE
jgi:hypothetical protein